MTRAWLALALAACAGAQPSAVSARNAISAALTLGHAIAEHGTPAGLPACASCHGARGEGLAAAGYPRLAGLPVSYFGEQLDAYAHGSRRSAAMQPIASLLGARERRAVALYYAGLPPPRQRIATGAQALPVAADRGARLAREGRWSERLPACSQCHGPDGEGVGEHIPPLAGQPLAYLRDQLGAWQSGARPAGPLGLMGVIAGKLSAADVVGVADYYASVGPLGAAARPPSIERGGGAGPASAREEAVAGARKFEPPPRGSEPSGELGRVIARGERIFTETPRYARAYIGNPLRCESCHLDAGRLADSAPLWAAYVLYPAYRAKNHHVNTFAERLQGCFRYSMNGRAPPLGSPTLVALETYAYWLARGAPTGVRLAGQGYPRLSEPPLPPNYARGAQLYAERCALCHGIDGAGQANAAGQAVFPALWGRASFNWGAGMASIDQAAGFVAANMPLALGGTLSVQQAWDVALYLDAHERPQDPRFTGSVVATRARFHDSAESMYGRVVNGHLLGSGAAAAPLAR
ncbi:MAG TPA: c-type cytochrome [Steroidobacteraceae bacterium]|nr:c-type cytochrome [Steroidobacteraceae bacterium]